MDCERGMGGVGWLPGGGKAGEGEEEGWYANSSAGVSNVLPS